MQLPVDAIYDVAPGAAAERVLLLMLPGAKNTPQQLAEHGFIGALRARALPVDVLALNAHVGLYLDHAEVERVLHHTLDELRAHGYRRIWVLGISLGASGAMICATQRTAEIEGVFLLAPFLGTRGIIAEVQAAGGLRSWQAGQIESGDHERALLEQIRRCVLRDGGVLPIYLGYGREDRYRDAGAMLSECLSRDRVTVSPGGHNWETWIALWRDLLDSQPYW